MRFSAPSVSTLSVLLLAKDVLAAVHGRHADYHNHLNLRDVVTVTDDVWVTVTMDIIDTRTETCYVTVEWSDPAATTKPVVVTSVVPVIPVVATTPTTSAAKPVTTSTTTPAANPVTTKPSTTSTTTAAPKPATTSTTSSDGGIFLQKTTTTSTKAPAAPTTPTTAVVAPTTMATVVKPTTSATPTPSVVTPPVVVAPVAGGKRGIAYNNPAFTFPFTSGQVSWAYNWDSVPSGSIRTGLEFVPLLWGMGSDHTSQWSAHASAAIASGSTHLLGFNEPDLGSQSNMDVATAVAGWKQYMEPFAGKALLISPAVTNGGSPMGLTWLQNFIQQCTNCNIHCVAIHWYDSATNLAYFKNHVTQAHTLTGKCIWLTEFAGSGTTDQQVAFIQQATAWLDSQPFVERYAYFMASQGSLINGNGLSALGTAYNS